MSEFKMEMGEELLEVLITKLGSEERVKAWVRDFAEWVDICIDDGDPDYVCVSNSDSSSSSDSESDNEDIPRSIVVEEEIETEVDENGFHSLKDCVVKNEK